MSPDDDAPAEPATRYSFPVEIEVVGELDEAHLNQLAEHVFTRLDLALRNRR